MTQVAPQMFAVKVELDGKSYSATCSSYAGVVTILHPDYNCGGAILRLGVGAQRTAQILLRSRLERLFLR